MFENDFTGLPPTLFRGVHVDFEPLHYRGEDLTCNFTAEWLKLKVRDWRDLAGVELRDAGEASFYTVEHDWARPYRLSITSRKGRMIRVEVDAKIEFPGFDEEDADPALPVKFGTALEFKGVLITDSIADRFADDQPGLRAFLSRFVDLGAFGSLRKMRRLGTFTCGPWLLP